MKVCNLGGGDMFVAATYRLPKAQCGSMTQWCLGAFGHCHISFPLSNAILFILQLPSFFIVRGRIQSCSFSSISHPDLPVAMHTFKEVSKEGNPQFRNTIEGFINHLSSGHLQWIESKFQSMHGAHISAIQFGKKRNPRALAEMAWKGAQDMATRWH